jgi:hypothetical protein
LFIGKASAPPANTQYVLEEFDGPYQVGSGFSPTAGTTDLLVVRADFTATGETFSLYVDPSLTSGEPAVANAVESTFDFGTFSQVEINDYTDIYFDEIRIGTTWSDVVVVPEPYCFLTVPLAVGLRRSRQRDSREDLRRNRRRYTGLNFKIAHFRWERLRSQKTLCWG